MKNVVAIPNRICLNFDNLFILIACFMIFFFIFSFCFALRLVLFVVGLVLWIDRLSPIPMGYLQVVIYFLFHCCCCCCCGCFGFALILHADIGHTAAPAHPLCYYILYSNHMHIRMFIIPFSFFHCKRVANLHSLFTSATSIFGSAGRFFVVVALSTVQYALCAQESNLSVATMNLICNNVCLINYIEISAKPMHHR